MYDFYQNITLEYLLLRCSNIRKKLFKINKNDRDNENLDTTERHPPL